MAILHTLPDSQAQADARAIVNSSGGDWHGDSGLMPCPVCQPERRRDQRALSIRNRPGGGLLVYCFKANCAFGDILDGLGLPYSPDKPQHPQQNAFQSPKGQLKQRDSVLHPGARDPQHGCNKAAQPATHASEDEAEKQRRALQIFYDGHPVRGDCLASRYLRGRGLDPWSAPEHSVRFNPATPWGGERVPAVVVRVQRLPAMKACGVQRIALDEDGGKRGTRMLGRAGYAFISPDTLPGPALVTEGPEDALAALMRYRLPVWCAMSASGLATFPVLRHWPTVAVLADGDGAGRAAALTMARRWRSAGRTVHVLDARDGLDPNAVVREVAP